MSGEKPKCNPKIENELSAACPSPLWIELPSDVIATIFKRLEMVDILEGTEKVCTTWRRVTCSDPSIWRVIHIIHTDVGNEQFCNLLRRAVDRSQGQLVDLSIKDSYTGSLLNYIGLNYIVDRSSDLKRLKLEDCGGITGKAVAEAVTKLPHLEELHLIGSPIILASDIVNIGEACPLLKSFTFIQSVGEDSNRNECAVAISKHMPNLCQLCLKSRGMDNEGLEAILDGCPNLESLFLPLCPELDLQRALRKRYML